MTPHRVLTTAAILIILAVSLLYDGPEPLPAAEPTSTPNVSCDYRYERRGLGWEPSKHPEI